MAKKNILHGTQKKSEPMHHYHLRKRSLKKNIQPHKFASFFDKAIYFLGLFGPIMTLPQIHKIWFYQNASGLSLVSWGAYMCNSCVWITYGILHKEKPIVMVYSFWIIVQFMVFTGTILYG